MMRIYMQSSTPLWGVLKLRFTDCMLIREKQTFHKNPRHFLTATIIKYNGERRLKRVDENNKVDETKITSTRSMFHLHHEIISFVRKEEEKTTNMI